MLAVLFVCAVALNYAWELAQSRLYTAASHTASVWFHCFVASLGDGAIILVLFAVGWLVSGRRDWFVRPRLAGYAVLVIAGAVVAMGIEWAALHVLQRWSYSDAMPRIIGTEVGLVPVLQMIILPALAFRLTAAVLARAQ